MTTNLFKPFKSRRLPFGDTRSERSLSASRLQERTAPPDELRREIGQHFIVGFHGYDVSADIEALIRDYHVGNIIITKRNVQTAEQIHALLCKLQQIAKDARHERPLMIGTDQENGLVSAFTLPRSDLAGTQFPGAMALAASGSPDLAERVSEASARELKFVGINWAFSPVADVNSNPRNPVIGVRSFGDVPEEVAEYVAAVCRGLTKAAVASSPKHFPGHGDTHIDSHMSLPVIPKDANSLNQSDLIPFRTALDAGAATIMVGHMALPAITSNTNPASLSRAIIKDLLRESLRYDGVVVTDCLEMEAVSAREGGVPVASVDALQAGADIVMICHRFDRQRDALEAVYSAIQGGTLDREQFRSGGRRIAALKDAFAGDWNQVLGTTFDDAGWSRLKAENKLLSRHAYASTIALVRNPNDVIPLPKALVNESRLGRGGGGIVVVLTPRTESYLAFAADISERVNGASLHGFYSIVESLDAELRGVIDRGEASSVLFVTRNADRSPWQLHLLREVLQLAKKEVAVVVLASCGPYDLLTLPASATNDEASFEGLDKIGYVVSFDMTANALHAAAAVIFGEEEAKGRVPVCGGNVFPLE
ncbi:glycoside hydrolase superfamily [Russula compacta]|nr:glycoside hydrolase superfamily [Russula compacta]